MTEQTNQPLAQVQEVTASLGNVTAVAVTPDEKFAYAVNFGDPSQITPFAINSSTGMLAPISAPIQSGYQSSYAAIDPLGRFLFIANSGNNQNDLRNVVETFQIEADGSLTSVGNPPQLPTCPVDMVVDINSKYLYVLCYNAGSDGSPAYVVSYQIQDNGTLVESSSVNVGSFGAVIAQSADGNFLFVVTTSAANPNNPGQLSVYPLNEGVIGSASEITQPTSTNQPNSITVTPSNRIYIGEDPSVSGHNPHLVNTQAISMFAFDSGKGTLSAAVETTPDLPVNDLAADASGSYLVVVGAGNIWTYPMNSDGTLGANSAKLSGGAGSSHLVIGPSTRFVYVADYAPAALQVFSLAAPTVQGSPTQTVSGTSLTLSFSAPSGTQITKGGFDWVTAAASRFPVKSQAASVNGATITAQVELPVTNLPAGCLVRPFFTAASNQYTGAAEPFNYGPDLFMTSATPFYDGSYRKVKFLGSVQPGKDFTGIQFQLSTSSDMTNPTSVNASIDGSTLTASTNLDAPTSATIYYARIVANDGSVVSDVVQFTDEPDVSIAAEPGTAAGTVSYQITINPIVTDICFVSVEYGEGIPGLWHGRNVSPPYSGTTTGLASGTRYDFRSRIKRNNGYPTISSVIVYVRAT